MDSKKTGLFLRELRKEKGFTQEQLAEQFHVSNRTVSRWETGSNMPDLSVLVELAEFYGVDIKELIDGERKSERMKEEVKEVAHTMADYAIEQKSRLLIWVRRVSLVGVILMTVVLGLQSFNYEPGIGSFLCYVFSVLAFVAMVIMSLYTNGLLAKLVKRKKFVIGCKIVVLIAGAAVVSFMVMSMLIAGIAFFIDRIPYLQQSEIKNYDKAKIIEEHGGDLSELFLFPDDTTGMLEPTFVSGFKSTFFDTAGYMFLQGTYTEEDYEAEVQRISGIECTVCDITLGVQYDEESYALPAYVAIDGVDSEYEYALLDEETHTITYVLLSYPRYDELREYEKYLKLDAGEYDFEEDTWDRFSIYVRPYGNGSYIEYSDEN